MRYEVIDTDSGEVIRRYPASDRKLAAMHANRAGCALRTIKQEKRNTPFMRAMEVAANFEPIPF